MKKSKAFTLIELVSVLVILAILALIVTPLVLNIIKKARTAADKRSIDAYGRSIELAIADYLLDKGTFPTSIEQLTIEYKGDKVECTTTTLKEDGSVYLAECTVAGRSVEGYTYGKEEAAPTYDAYEVGDIIQYNGVQYYVIKDSDETETSVTLLKAEPLTYEETQTYSSGTGTEISDRNGYGGMQYHSSSNNYETSYIKTTVNAWKAAQAQEASEARLITFDELTENLGFELQQVNPTAQAYKYTESTPSWVYSYNYWTMTPYDNGEENSLICVSTSGNLYDERANNSDPATGRVGSKTLVVRPVIVLNKSVLN